MTRRLSVTLLAWIVAAALVALPAAAQPAPGATARPGAADDTDARVKELKLQALDAESAGDRRKAIALYQQVLRFNPDDALARQQIKTLGDAIDRERETSRTDRLAALEGAAKASQLSDLVTKAEQAILEANATGAGEPLDRAADFLKQADRYAAAGDPELARVRLMYSREVERRRIRFWELWGGIGIVVLALLVGAVLYFRRTERVLEMTDGPQPGHVFAIDKPTVAVGALATEVDWAIADPLRKISRHHCDVIRDGRRYFLVDRSMNGTFLNGQAIRKGEPVLLKRGDRIGLGGEVTLLFR